MNFGEIMKAFVRTECKQETQIWGVQNDDKLEFTRVPTILNLIKEALILYNDAFGTG